MDFREGLQVMEEASGFRMFKAIKLGPFSLSIQASKAHYCSPRETRPVEEYKTWEIMVSKNGEDWVPQKDPQFADLGENWNELGAFIPTERVQAIYNRCRMLWVTGQA